VDSESAGDVKFRNQLRPQMAQMVNFPMATRAIALNLDVFP
jgi:hypothetical protein